MLTVLVIILPEMISARDHRRVVHAVQNPTAPAQRARYYDGRRGVLARLSRGYLDIAPGHRAWTSRLDIALDRLPTISTRPDFVQRILKRSTCRAEAALCSERAQLGNDAEQATCAALRNLLTGVLVTSRPIWST